MALSFFTKISSMSEKASHLSLSRDEYRYVDCFSEGLDRDPPPSEPSDGFGSGEPLCFGTALLLLQGPLQSPSFWKHDWFRFWYVSPPPPQSVYIYSKDRHLIFYLSHNIISYNYDGKSRIVYLTVSFTILYFLPYSWSQTFRTDTRDPQWT